MKIKCPAKINLYLNILNKREDGYHDIRTIVQTINLFDEIEMKKRKDNKIVITCTNDEIPTDETNSVYKAILKYYSYINKPLEGYDIHIVKNIPNKAGLGGESTDAVGVIKLLNRKYKLNDNDLIKISNQIGNDCKFFIKCGCQDENLKKIVNQNKYYLLLNNENDSCSTKEMFKKYDELNNFKKIKKEINFINDFEKIYNVKNTKEKLFNMGCESACLTGSGSYVVGILNKKTTNCYQNYNLKSK